MTRPTIEEIEKDYKNYLIKLKGYGLCFLAKDCDGRITFYNKEKLEVNSPAGVMDLDDTLYDYFDEGFCACAIAKLENEMSPISHVINDNKLIHWDWTDEPVEMTLSEVCKALGKNIKIIKE
jgi:hypothetical protein